MPGCGARAVPARGLATRSRAALGISPSALGPGREVRRWTQGQAGTGNTRLTKAATSQEAWPEAEPRTTTRPLGENRGGTPIDVRLPYRGRGRARKARQITALRLSAFCFRFFFVLPFVLPFVIAGRRPGNPPSVRQLRVSMDHRIKSGGDEI